MDKKEVTFEIVKLLENNHINFMDWEKIKTFIDDTFVRINSKSNFASDKVTENRINAWF